MKGCIRVSAWRIGESLIGDAYEVSSRIKFSANRVGENIHFMADSLNPTLNISAIRIGKRLRVSAHRICTVNKTSFLNVNPDYVWLTPDVLSSGEFDIISNVNWFVV